MKTKAKTNPTKQARTERKIPLGEACAIADAICEHLLPWCEKIDVVGSVRRCESEVGDIDIVLRPLLVFSESDNEMIRAPRWHDAMRSLGVMDATAKNSKPMSQRRNVKVTLPWAGGTKVDLWIPQAHDYGRIMALRAT
jgi:DNA polymerase/3'-5' exonuclease PolX